LKCRIAMKKNKMEQAKGAHFVMKEMVLSLTNSNLKKIWPRWPANQGTSQNCLQHNVRQNLLPHSIYY